MLIQNSEARSMAGYVLNPPPLPTWRRYRSLFSRPQSLSLLRSLEYEILSKIPISGRLLDFGGGDRANYPHLINYWRNVCRYESANIDPGIAPTYLLLPGQPLPIPDDSFDAVVTLNTLEHIYDVKQALAELLRVLRPEGRIIITVPFLFRIHGHPDDFFRATPSWWSKTLNLVGFTAIAVTPLLWGPMSTSVSVVDTPAPLRRLRLHGALLLDLLYAVLRYPADEQRYVGPVGAAICNAPLGFFITAMKPAGNGA